jgi:hypothetical protein
LGNSGFNSLQEQQKRGGGGGRGAGGGGGEAAHSPPRQRKQSSSKKKSDDADAAKRKQKKRRARTFPEKLMQAMVEGSPNEDAVAWLPDGKSFVVVDADMFVKDVLAMVFKECKYASFVRKLHRWGFVRLTSGTGTDCFHHPLFQKGRRDLASKINCTSRDKEPQLIKGGRFDKPPSLAGVERFIRARAVAAAKAAQQAGAAGLPPFGASAAPSAAAQAVAAAAAAGKGPKAAAAKSGEPPPAAAPAATKDAKGEDKTKESPTDAHATATATAAGAGAGAPPVTC